MADLDPVPSWDNNYPASQQQAQVAIANGGTANVTMPKMHAQAEVDPNNTAAQLLPDTSTDDQTPAQPTDGDAPPSFDEAMAQQEQAQKLTADPEQPPSYDEALAQSQQPLNELLEFKLPDNKALKSYVDSNLQVFNANASGRAKKPSQREASDFLEAAEAGWQMSVSGLGIRGEMPNMVLPEHSGAAFRIANQIGTLAGDMPAVLAGGILGGFAGGATGATVGSVVPVAGTAVGGIGLGAVGASAGSFAVPAAVRKMMIDHYERGDITTASEFTDRLMATTWEATKGAVTGAATALTGGAATVAGPLVKFGAELATMTTVGAAMEGHLPDSQDFIDGAIVMGGLHGVGMVSSKLLNIHAATGEVPTGIAAVTENDAELKQQLLGHDLASPPQAAPTDLVSTTVKPETEGGETMIEHKLVPKDLNINPPKPLYVPENLSEAEKSIHSMIGVQEEPKAKTTSEKFDEYYAKNVDWTDPLKVAYAAWSDATRQSLPDAEKPHVAARLFAGHSEFARRVINDGVPDVNGNFSSADTDSLTKIYNDVPNDEQGKFDLYSIAKRALELDEQGKNPGANFDREQALKVVEDGQDKYQELHERRVQVMNDMIDYGVKKGVIDPFVARATVEQSKEYVPFSRIIPPDELTGEIGSNGSLVKKIEGSELDIKNPRQGFYNNIEAIVRRAKINDIRLKTMDNLSYVNEAGEKVNDFLREVQVNGPLEKNQIAIFRDGKISALEGTPLVIDSLKRLEGDPGMMDNTLKFAANFSKALRVGTTADPGFGLRHFIRSSVMSGVYSQTGQIPFIHPLMAFGEFMGKSSETYKNFLSDGGSTQGFEELDKNYIQNDLQKADSKYPFLDQAWNVIKKPFEASEAFIKMTDNLSRFTEYKRAIAQGESRTTAALLAREVTPDFAKQGLERSAFRQLVAFQGAHINSLDRMRQAFVEDTQGTILRMSAMTVASAALWYANKDDKEIAALPNYQKDLYWNFNVSRMFDSDYSKKTVNVNGQAMNEATIFRIPKPWGPGIMFGSGTERTLDALYKKDPDAFKDFGHSLFESVVPNIIPTAAAPVLDQLANKNLFTGRQLVNREQEKETPDLKYQPYTSETAKQIAKIIGYVPGANDIGPSIDPITSPAVVENYIRSWTGIAGGWALKIGDAGLRAAGITPKNTGMDSPDTPLAEEPILNEFLTRFPTMKEQPVQGFYKNLDDINTLQNSMRAYAKKGDAAKWQSLYIQSQQLGPRLQPIANAINLAKKSIDQIQSNTNIDPTQKRQIIDTHLFQIGSMARMGNQMTSDFKKQFNSVKEGK